MCIFLCLTFCLSASIIFFLFCLSSSDQLWSSRILLPSWPKQSSIKAACFFVSLLPLPSKLMHAVSSHLRNSPSLQGASPLNFGWPKIGILTADKVFTIFRRFVKFMNLWGYGLLWFYVCSLFTIIYLFIYFLCLFVYRICYPAYCKTINL